MNEKIIINAVFEWRFEIVKHKTTKVPLTDMITISGERKEGKLLLPDEKYKSIK